MALDKINQGLALHHQGRLADAEQIYLEILQQQPNHYTVLHLLGIIALQTSRKQYAVDLITKAMNLSPNVAEVHNHLGISLRELKRLDESLASYDRALALKPDFAEAYNNRGNVLRDLKQFDGSLASYDKAIALKFDFPEAHNNRGHALYALERFNESLASADRAIALKPDFAEAHRIRALALVKLNRHEAALTAFDKAFASQPNLPEVEGDRLFAKMVLCDWKNFDSECKHLIGSVRSGTLSTKPFVFLAIPSSSAEQLECAKLWIASNRPPSETSIWNGQRYDHDRIRVAYLSPDFRNHATMILSVGMFERHDRQKFEITAISSGPDDGSEMRQRLKHSFDRFIDVEKHSDDQIAHLVKGLEIDILVDLAGLTGELRTGIFAKRPAPVQVNYLGYPGTLGAGYIDYILADRIVIPENQREFYSEKIVYLPNTYMPSDSKRVLSDRVFDRARFGLPQSGFVFCCFNNSYKLNPSIFDCWMRVLKKVKGSVLWLSENSLTAAANLKKEANLRGINPDRLVFAARMPLLADHLARHRLADLFLDTLPYNAHTTASDALWAGLPVLTCFGETFAARVAASLLNAIGHPELITTTLEAYEQTAIDLAIHPDKLTLIKRKLAENRLSTPLFDTKLFTKHVEAAYVAMHARYQAGLRPDHIVVSS